MRSADLYPSVVLIAIHDPSEYLIIDSGKSKFGDLILKPDRNFADFPLATISLR